jgi:crotonobetainyl-CoA:carnitine CoA-transferase CaiB-like acyl-CoA transferase
VLPYSASNFDDLFREGGRHDLVGDPRVQTAATRNRHAPALYEALGPVIATRSTAFWVAFCEEHDIPAAAVRSLDEIVGELPVVQHPHSGAYREIPPPTRFSRTPATVRRAAPMLGEHDREVLRDVGFGDDEIDALVAGGVLRHAAAES